MSIHQEVTFQTSPERLYQLLTDDALFAAVTAAPAKIEPSVGAAFSIFDGRIEGRQIELVPGQRIVQAWSGSDWPAGVFFARSHRLECHRHPYDTLLTLRPSPVVALSRAIAVGRKDGPERGLAEIGAIEGRAHGRSSVGSGATPSPSPFLSCS